MRAEGALGLLSGSWQFVLVLTNEHRIRNVHFCCCCRSNNVVTVVVVVVVENTSRNSHYPTFLFGGSVRIGVERRVVFLSDVEVLVRSSTGVGFARFASASVGTVARMAECGLRRGIV